MAKTKVKYAIVADTETGGLPNSKNKAFDDVALTEIAFVAVDLVELRIIDKASWLVKPYKEGLEYNIHAQKVSGITPSLLESKGEDLGKVYNETKSMLKKYTVGKMGRPVFVGHNMEKFDKPFFVNMYKHFEDDFDEYISCVEDTMQWAGMKFLESKDYKLGTICNNVGVELTDAHRALADTVSNAEMFIEMVKCLRGSGEVEKEKNKFRDKFKLDVGFNF